MGSDLVERLRQARLKELGTVEDFAYFFDSQLGKEAAARITELEAALSAEKAKVAEAVRERDKLLEAKWAARRHAFASDWYRPGTCMGCSYPREHPIHRAALGAGQ